MDWIKVTIPTTNEGIEYVLGRLLNIGIDSTIIEDETDFKSFLEENRSSWDYVDEELVKKMEAETKISFYIESGNLDMVLAVKSEIEDLKKSDISEKFGRLEVELQNIVGEDWLNNWKKYFHTFEIDNDLIIKPYWENVENTDKKIFEINPGLSFGTGTHHTTKMCLEDIIHTVKANDNVLDLGCGSGILSIVSLIYGAKYAVAVDIDENSLKTAYENLERNSISKEKYKVFIGDILSNEALKQEISSVKYDLILANIVADVIISILPIVKSALKDGGVFITSGIIEDRIDDVKAKLSSNGFVIISEKRSADWAEFKCRLA